MTGADPRAMIAMLEGLRVDALGMNCSLGPKQMLELLPQFRQYASIPVIVTPNAGLPRLEHGITVFDVGPEEFAETGHRACKRRRPDSGGLLWHNTGVYEKSHRRHQPVGSRFPSLSSPIHS